MANAKAIATLRASLNENVKARSQYEAGKNDAETITAQLIKHFKLDHATLETTLTDAWFEAAALMGITSFDFINSAKRSTNRFNIKACEKVKAHVDSVMSGKLVKATATAQKYCAALMLTMIKQRKSEYSLTRRHAYAMFSTACRYPDIKVGDFAQKLNVQESTATTQASSSFRTLDALGVCSFDEENKTVSNVDYDHALFAVVESTLLQKAA